MDAEFAHFGAVHRKARHHVEGVQEAASIFGASGGQAALLHVLRDCLHLPRLIDYSCGAVDALGIPVWMSISDVVRFGEKDFMELARRHLGSDQSEDLLIWAWIDDEEKVRHLLRGVTHDPNLYVERLSAQWAQAREALQLSKFQTSDADIRYFDASTPDVSDAFKPLRTAMEETYGEVRFAFVRATALINPLMIFDTEFAEFLRPELEGKPGDATAIEFAFPPRVNVKVQTLSDARSATVITKFHQFSLTDVRADVVQEAGIEVCFSINPIPQLIIVTEVNGRFYLQAGMHRALVLAQAGYTEIPCAVVKGAVPPTVTGPYPTYGPNVLRQSRPPLLLDTFDPTFSLSIKYRRTNKVLRIAAEDFSIPVE